MKKKLLLLGVLTASLIVSSLHAQFGPPGGSSFGPKFDAAMTKLFGENPDFSADLDYLMKEGSKGKTMTMPGKLAFSAGKSRFEMNLAAMQGGQMTPETAAQMAAMGMDQMILISQPEQKLIYLIYPGLKAYATNDMKEVKDAKLVDSYKTEITELGKETVEGHPCVKNKIVVTDDKGKQRESIVWNATDLKKFPVKIEGTNGTTGFTMLFKNIKLAKPESSLFDPPTDFTPYGSMQVMMQAEMMKRMSEGGFTPPPRKK